MRTLALLLGLTFAGPSTTQGAESQTVTLATLGAKGDGQSDDSAALQKGADMAAKTPGMTLKGERGKVYVLRKGLALQGDFRLDLGGGTLKPTGGISNLISRSVPKAAAVAILSGQDGGSTRLRLADAKDFHPGDLVRVTTGALAGMLVPDYSTIKSVVGEEVTLDAPLPYSYPAPASLQRAEFSGGFLLSNGIIDGTAWRSPNAAVFVGGYDRVEIHRLILSHCIGSATNWVVPQVNRSVVIKDCKFLDNAILESGEAVNVWDAQDVHVEGVEVRGTGFGISVVRSDHVLVENNRLQGDADIHPRQTVRGIKLMACRGGVVRGNTVRNYTNAIKCQDSSQCLVEDNTCLDSSPGDPTSYAIAVSNENPDREHQSGHRILRNIIEGSGGSGIYLGKGSPGCVVEGNRIHRVGSFGIAVFTDGAGDHSIRNNTIEDFDRADKGMTGIYLGASGACEDNTISEPTGKKAAIRLGVSVKSSVEKNQTPKGNPLLEEAKAR